ncbi:ATP-dependent DNA ligase [Adhaeribacter aerolatus]|uniref:ATP-dependent DNA ligase n=1 Tax=Adhaeribacter aerolatus TaxID=670289 RepID=A0A512B507_9BACT|nr:non-homologous end-joining DNA ligase [Adhaeribacter aerolatus]GEO07065.1 ATP-dependent DNA ligase [Adhaeribacter aerolatus]
MGLQEYNQKRDFSQTKEPADSADSNKGALKFVVQRHEASKLHYDFRLEMEGVLKSWAVPKGPSLNPNDKRLAMMVEDHPFSYRTFEGDIPAGNYGAGHVAIWDEGDYQVVDMNDRKKGEQELLAGLQNGSIRFVLHGKKLRGEFALIRMKGRQENAWLLVKKPDDWAVPEAYDAEDFVEGSKRTKTKTSAKEQNKPKVAAKKSDMPEASEKKLIKPKGTGRIKEKAVATKEKKAGKDKSNKEEDREIEGQVVHLTSLDKLYWSDEHITKGDLINYYQNIADILLPYLIDRPESLLRHPNGAGAPGFFQKDVGDNVPEWIETTDIHSESTNQEVNYIVCQHKATLAYMNNLGCIQLNPWNSRIQALEKPDWAVIDLDPGENTYDEVIEVALLVKEIADAIGADCYAKTSGATGMHLYFPLQAKYPFAEVKEFAHLLAKKVHAQLPQLTSLERQPKERRYQIYLDFLQNAIGQTIAAPYCVRPKPGATVSAPLAWTEVKKGLHPAQFTIKNMPERLKQKGDLFKGVLGQGIGLPKCLQALKKSK